MCLFLEGSGVLERWAGGMGWLLYILRATGSGLDETGSAISTIATSGGDWKAVRMLKRKHLERRKHELAVPTWANLSISQANGITGIARTNYKTVSYCRPHPSIVSSTI